jgi:hypothetical protein
MINDIHQRLFPRVRSSPHLVIPSSCRIHRTETERERDKNESKLMVRLFFQTYSCARGRCLLTRIGIDSDYIPRKNSREKIIGTKIVPPSLFWHQLNAPMPERGSDDFISNREILSCAVAILRLNAVATLRSSSPGRLRARSESSSRCRSVSPGSSFTSYAYA